MLISTKRSLVCTLGLLALLFGVAGAQETATQEADPTPAETLIQLADQQFLRGDCFVAQIYYQKALEHEPENLTAKLGQAKTLACQGALAEAINIDQAVLQADPGNVTALLQLADAYQEQYFSDPSRYPNRLMDALETVNRAERLDPNSARVLNLKGTILYNTGDYAGARTALERAISLASGPDAGYSDIDRSVMNTNLGKALMQLGELELAKTVFQRAVRLNPSSASAHNNLGSVYYQLGDCEQAPYELSQAVALDPTSQDAIANLGIALFECDQVQSAIEPLERAVAINAGLSAPPLYTYLARAYLQQGRADDAVERAQMGALLPPHSAEAYYWLGQAYEARGNDGDLQEAREAYQRALELNPNFAPANRALEALQ